MPLHATPPSRHADVTRRLRERGILRDAASSEPLNLDAAAALVQDDTCEYRGVRYRVPPIPVHVGLMLVRIQRRLGAAVEAEESDETLRELLTIAEEAAVIFREFAVPVSRWRRWHLRLDRRHNPFRAMSAAELGALLF